MDPALNYIIEWLVGRYGNRLRVTDDGMVVLTHPSGNYTFDVRELITQDGKQEIVIPTVEFQRRAVIPRMSFVIGVGEGEIPMLASPEQMANRKWEQIGDELHFYIENMNGDGPSASVAFESTLPEAQLALDGREIRTDQIIRSRHMGIAQEEVIKYVKGFTPTATEMGTHLHLLADSRKCGSYARDKKYKGAYKGDGCCREASSRGSVVLKSLEKGGAVWKDRNERWHARREDWA